MAALFDNIVLSPLEDLIIESLKIIEPKIERIASIGSGNYSTSNNLSIRGGFLIWGAISRLAGKFQIA